jgi:hypothetical protein
MPQGEITVGGSLTVLSCRDGVKINPLLLPNPILVFSAGNKRRITKDVFQGFQDTPTGKSRQCRL